MDHPERPHILIVDDMPERHTLAVEAAGVQGENVVVRHPLDLEEEDLFDVDLVCVDEYLGDEWASVVRDRADGLVALRNEDGLAVAAALRSRARLNDDEGRPGFGVALLTAALADLAAGLPEPHQEPLTAAQHDLEWVFRFNEGASTNLPRMIELARAARSLINGPAKFGDDSGAGWLELPESDWESTAAAQIDDCRPPAHDLSFSTRGRSYLRWMTQRILPYPTFLLDALYASNLLGISRDSFVELADSESLSRLGAQYVGPLSDTFAGPRWWRAGLQQFLLDCGSSQWEPTPVRAEAVRNYTGLDLTSLESQQAVITYSYGGFVTSSDASAEDAVRIQIDGWPVYADDPWALLSDVGEDVDLRRLVAFDDRARLGPES
ncbi:hypothetical protein ACIGB8_10570 [Promicromonospora sukumoe]|uniref:hypothetical protein n=1 Tax=Promicromonospora sukumoe TaxID=88382 RepID=UPI0037C7E316